MEKLIERIVVKTEIDAETARPHPAVSVKTYFDSDDDPDDEQVRHRLGILDDTLQRINSNADLDTLAVAS